MRVAADRRQCSGAAAGPPRASRGRPGLSLADGESAPLGQARSGKVRRRMSAAMNCSFHGQATGSARCRRRAARPIHGLHLPARGLRIVTPVGWRYEDSLSARQRFVPTENVAGERKFLRHEPDGVDAYLDFAIADKVFMSRVCATGGDSEAGAGTEAGGDTGALGDDGPIELMTDEYVQTAVPAIGAPDLTPAERDKLRTLLVAARSHDKLSGWAKRRYAAVSIQHVLKYGRRVDDAGRARREAWDAAALPERLRLEGLSCPELEALHSSPDAEDVQARERADAALAALVQLVVVERRQARRSAATRTEHSPPHTRWRSTWNSPWRSASGSETRMNGSGLGKHNPIRQNDRSEHSTTGGGMNQQDADYTYHLAVGSHGLA